ncbi:ankyrin repeat and LEM domain-containing protein 2 homolog [Drosophila tropicalis]|uniref:ankyrin repeat and LEM domain-containing protein 2 homolog n=1 Tax=Drosophila tropicalis TaxID=46794 RepID=UPI0035ABCCEE
MSFFGVYIPPSKDGFEGTAAKCAGSIAAINIRTSPEVMAGAGTSATGSTATGSNDTTNDYKYEDPEYPPDSPLWLIFMEKSKALDVLRIYKEGRLREFPNREQAESYVQFGFESIESLKRFGKSSSSNNKSASKTNPHSPSNNHLRGAAGGNNSTDGSNGGATANWSSYSSSPTSGSNAGNAGSPLSSICSLLANFSNQSSTANHHNNINNNNNNSITMSRQESAGSLSTSSAATTSSSSSSTTTATVPSSSSSSSSALSSINAERQAFRAPTKQELVEFRKLIEVGNVSRVKRIVWENPRYIISNGDTPTSLKEGYRYNAMHICAQTNQARVAELLLKILADREFTQLFVGKKGSGEMCAALNDNILDYYLNMPDKGRGETPLHFAVKNGHVAMVEVLISYPQCKSLANIEGKYPKDIICYRAPNAGPEIVRKLQVLLSDPYYVPVLRAAGNELPPQVGQPYTPHEQPLLQSKCEENERLSVDLAISAVAGPMPRDTAYNFYRRWKTPPRISNNTISPLTATPHSPYDSPVKTTPNKSIFNRSSHYGNGNGSPNLPSRRVLFSPKLLVENSIDAQESSPSSPSLCIENNNNNNCLKMLAGKRRLLDLPATPLRQMKRDLFEVYRNNQDCDQSPIAGDLHSYSMMDISSPRNGLDDTWNDSFLERHIKNSDIEKGLEVVGRQLAHHEQLEWREYWDFLDSFVDIATPDGLNCLESYLLEKSEQEQQTLLLQQQQQAQSERLTDQNLWNFAQLDQYLDLVADGLDKELSSSSSTAAAAASGALTNITNNHKTTITTTTQVMTPYTCVEKSLQVFAKRITKTIINNIGNMVSINDTLLSELKRLKSLIVSFKDDSRFLTVDFSKVHSRIAHLVASYIAHSQEVSVAMCLQLLQMLRKLLKLAGERREHLECVCAGLRSMLETTVSTAEAVSPDALKTEDLCSAAWEAEKSCACIWDANLSRKTSRRKRTESYRAAQAQAKNHAHNQAQVNMQTQPLTSQTAATLRVGSMTNMAVVTSGKKSCFSDWRSTNNNSDDDDDDDNGAAGEDSDDDDDGTLYYDCRCSASDSINSSDDEQEDLYLTPPSNLSPRHSIQLDELATPRYELFIFGKEPTKRDLDVLNAIFHVDIKKETLPHVHAWKSAMESFSTAEMELFPSPRNIKKTHKPIYSSNGNGGGRPLKAGQNGGSTSEAVPLF